MVQTSLFHFHYLEQTLHNSGRVVYECRDASKEMENEVHVNVERDGKTDSIS